MVIPAFRMRWVPFLATLCVVAIGIALGQWQLQRAHDKEALERRQVAASRAAPQPLSALQGTPDELEFRRISVSGEFILSWPLYLNNRPYKGQAGFHVLMPLQLAHSKKVVLVARGWLPRDPTDRLHIASYDTPTGSVEIEGIIRVHAGRLLQLGQPAAPTPGAVVQNLELADVAVASGLAVAPFIVEQTSSLDDGLVRDWPPPSAGIDTHYGYAFQWFGLAATAFFFFVVSGFRHGKK